MKFLHIFGTRPEAIKMAPVIEACERDPAIDNLVCLTGQHREMLDQVITFFDIRVDFDLDVMRDNQPLSETTAVMLSEIAALLRRVEPDLILVHGDTNSTLAASLAAFQQKIPVAHIEAGLRTGDMMAPWPEEANRRMVDILARFHFAPTHHARENLLRENTDPASISVTGNSVVDALYLALKKIDGTPDLRDHLAAKYSFLAPEKKLLLVTGHRRENFGDGINNICDALSILAKRNDLVILYPVHPNPNIADRVNSVLGNSENIHLCAPLDYAEFVYLMQQAHLILTDSGGIQEEAPSLNKPVLVMRTVTERPEALEAGTIKLVGTDTGRIVSEVEKLMTDTHAYRKMAQAPNPYGDGQAAARIIEVLKNAYATG